MGSKKAGAASGLKGEIHFSDLDAGASLPKTPAPALEQIVPPEAPTDKRTIPEWARLEGHVDPGPPPGGYQFRGQRFKGFDWRVLEVRLRAQKRWIVGQLFTRDEYLKLVDEARSVPMSSGSGLRAQVEAMEPHKGGFRRRQAPKAAAEAVKES